MAGLSSQFFSSVVGIGKSRSLTPFAKATESLIFLPTMVTPKISVFMLIVTIPTRLIELFGAIM
ncbi:hypothetical protein LINPERHAP1_LOCUS21393 [Linum perenne]